MDKEMKEKWIASLRSGEYPQTRQVLHRVSNAHERGLPAGYCCLGVLCDLAAKEGKGSWAGPDNDDDDLFIYKSVKSATNPPSLLLIDLDIPDTMVENLVHMNDIHKKSFEEIATWIERYL